MLGVARRILIKECSENIQNKIAEDAQDATTMNAQTMNAISAGNFEVPNLHGWNDIKYVIGLN